MPSRTHPLASLHRAAAILVASILPGIAAAAQAAPDYSGFTAARFVPFVAPMSAGTSSYHGPELRFAIRGRNYTAVMDTGSTGVMLSASRIPGYTPKIACQDPSAYSGWEFLSSSKLLWVGHWIPEEIHFLDAGGTTLATATVPVLAVECEALCPHYNERKPGPECPGGRLVPAKPTIHYMGVGFGREHDGQPQGTPDKNPLLNITSIGGKPVQPGTMRSGYVLTPQGVHVGLTPAKTSGFVYTKLSCSQPRDCSQASICAAVDGSGCAQGSVLVDTGIPQMYLTAPRSIPVKAQSAKDLSDPSRQVCVLRNGSRVTVRFGAPDVIAFYSFVAGQSPPQPTQPAQVILPSSTGGVPPSCVASVTPSGTPSRPAFVNTGGNFLQGFDVLFDADGGFFGLRWTGPANSPEGGLGSGPQTPSKK